MTQILNRFTGAVITEGDMPLRELVLHYVRDKGHGANLCDANLRGANLRGANFCGADLCGADLCGANYNNIKINKCAVFTGLYLYVAMPIIDTEGKEFIRLGCHFRTVEDWATDFWNNPSEFPNNGNTPSKLRWMAYQTCLQWLEIHREGL